MTEVIYSRNPDYADLSGRDMVMLEERTSRIEMVSLEAIFHEDMRLDEDNLVDLKKDLEHNEQRMPIELAAFMGEGQVIYKVVDGFHRHNTLIGLGRENALAVVNYGMTETELHAARIRATTIGTVKFSRNIVAMQASWALTPWSETITLEQAFILYNNQKSTGKNIGVLESAEEIKQWVKASAKEWGKVPASIYIDLLIASHASPALIDQVRVGGGGRDGKGVISVSRLAEIVKLFPDAFEWQHHLAKAVIDYNLTAKQLQLLSPVIVKNSNNGHKLLEIFANPKRYLPKQVTGHNRSLTKKGLFTYKPEVSGKSDDWTPKPTDNATEHEDIFADGSLDQLVMLAELTDRELGVFSMWIYGEGIKEIAGKFDELTLMQVEQTLQSAISKIRLAGRVIHESIKARKA